MKLQKGEALLACLFFSFVMSFIVTEMHRGDYHVGDTQCIKDQSGSIACKGDKKQESTK